MTITIDDHPGSVASLCFEVDPDMSMSEFTQVCRAMAFAMGYDFDAIGEHMPEERYYPRELDNEL